MLFRVTGADTVTGQVDSGQEKMEFEVAFR